jgi:cell division protein FtsB
MEGLSIEKLFELVSGGQTTLVLKLVLILIAFCAYFYFKYILSKKIEQETKTKIDSSFLNDIEKEKKENAELESKTQNSAQKIDDLINKH